jgi:DNA-binding transcriptional MerR regulator
MTHFTIGIIVPPDEHQVKSFIAEQMEPYCENTEVELYVCYSLEEAAADLERDIKRLEQILRRQNPDYNLDKCRDLLAKLRRTTPEEKYAEHIRLHERFDDQGQPISTYNPDSKWDWYRIGGRWDGWITGNEQSSEGGFNFGAQHETLANNAATTEQVLAAGKIPHAIITPDGEWHERGQMGWWANLITENEDWDSDAKAILARYPGHRLVILDAHI